MYNFQWKVEQWILFSKIVFKKSIISLLIICVYERNSCCMSFPLIADLQGSFLCLFAGTFRPSTTTLDLLTHRPVRVLLVIRSCHGYHREKVENGAPVARHQGSQVCNLTRLEEDTAEGEREHHVREATSLKQTNQTKQETGNIVTAGCEDALLCDTEKRFLVWNCLKSPTLNGSSLHLCVPHLTKYIPYPHSALSGGSCCHRNSLFRYVCRIYFSLSHEVWRLLTLERPRGQ